MFKKLLSDRVISALKTLPVWAWWIIYAVVAFFASAAYIVDSVEMASSMLAQSFASLYGAETYNASSFVVLLYVGEVILPVLIFEFFAYLVYSLFGRRFYINMNQTDFVFRLRIFFIVVNLLVGIASIPAFFFESESMGASIMSLITSDLTIGLRGLFLIGFFYEISKRYLSGHLVARGFLFITRFYLMIYGIIQAVSLLTATMNGNDLLYVIECSIGLVFVAGLAVLAYFYWKKLKEIETDPPKPSSPDEKKEDDVVFKDFGI